MRKLALISVMCVLAAEVSAQSHSFRDTTYVRYQQFDFDAWMWEDTVHHGKVLCERPQFPGGCSVMGYDDILQYNYTDNPAGVEVFGLSAVISISPAQESNPPAEYR